MVLDYKWGGLGQAVEWTLTIRDAMLDVAGRTDARLLMMLDADDELRIDQLDHVAIGRDPRANLGAKVRRTLRHRPGLSFIRARASTKRPASLANIST